MYTRARIIKMLVNYAVAIVTVLLALAGTWHLKPLLGETISPLFFAAVMISAWYGGWGPGVLATGLSGYFTTFWFVNPPQHPGFGWDDSIRLIVFLMVALLISFLTFLRKRAEAALQQSHDELEIRIGQRTRELSESNALLSQTEERFRLLVEGVADYAIVMLDWKGRVISWNAGAQRIYGYKQDDAMGLDVSTFFVAEDLHKQATVRHLLEAGEHGRHEDEGWRVRKDGSRFWANVITTALHDDRQHARGFAQVTRDVSEIRALEKEVLDISEREQMRIGHDLHDGIGQELTGLALLTQNLQHKLSAQHIAEGAEAGRIAALINRTLDQTRLLVRGFSPMELGPEGLATALGDMAAKVHASTRKPCLLQCRGMIKISDDVVAVHLYRIAQEAVNNAVRHAQAARIQLRLEQLDGVVSLSVEDDGVGLPLAGERGPGIGISVMKYRARMIGATLEIRSSAQGTTVLCKCSLKDPHESNLIPVEPSGNRPTQAARARVAG